MYRYSKFQKVFCFLVYFLVVLSLLRAHGQVLQSQGFVMLDKHISTDSLSHAFTEYKELLQIDHLDHDLIKFAKLSLDLSNKLYDKNRFGQALEIVMTLDSISNFNNNIYNEMSCKIAYSKGLIYYRNNDLTAARSQFNQSYILADSQNNDSIRILSLKSIGNIYFLSRKYIDALRYYKKSLKDLSSNSFNSEIIVSSLLQNIGISYSMLNNNDSALIFLSESVKLKEMYLNISDPVLASGYLNISRLYQLNGELTKALEYIDRAEKIYIENYSEQDPVLAPFYFNKGSILINLNDYDESLHYHELALELYKVKFNSSDEIFQELYLNFGVLNSNLGNIIEAINYFKKCLIGNASNERLVKGNLLLGIEYLKSKDFVNAEKYLQKSINLAVNELGVNNSQTANSYLNYGVFCEQTKKSELALEYYLQAAELFESIYGEKSRDLSNTLTLLGNYYANIGLNSNSLDYFQEALIAFIPEFNEKNTSVNPDFNILESDLNLFYTLSGKANTLYRIYLENPKQENSLEACLETSILAIRLFEKVKSTLYGENTKLIVTGRVNQVYNLATTAAAQLYKNSGEAEYLISSFKYSEKSKAAVLLSTVKEITAIQVGNIPFEIKEKEKILKRKISQYQNIIYEENQKESIDSEKIVKMRNRLFETKISYDSLINSLESNYPEYYNLKYNLDVIAMNDIRAKLNKNQAFIEYKLTDSILFSFILKRDTALLLETKISPSFSDKIHRYVNLINQFPQADSVSYRSYRFAQLGTELSDKLQLNHSILNSIQSLIVIPDDVLGYLSFEALISEVPEKQNSKYNRLMYLIQKYSFSYGYSATLFFNTIQENNNGRKVLAMAPEYNNPDRIADAEFQSGLRNIERDLIPLPHTKEEVLAISEIFPGTQLVGNMATEKEFKQKASDYRILHFAMHTLINDEEPLASKLVFARSNDSIEDGFLNTYEIYNLDLQAELAVLSACKTGTGAISKGEGIMSLARGFLYAGVPGIIMTLWAVEDMSSAEIITGFYKNLKLGENKADALRNSKLEYLSNANQIAAHPYFWAAYVQIGDNSPIHIETNKYIYYSSAGAVILILLALIGIRRARRKLQ